MSDDKRAIQREFERVADLFAERTQGRFDELDVVGFSRVRPGSGVAEVGAGTGNFLALFSGIAGRLIAVDLTPAMLEVARRRHEGIEVVAADGASLPIESGSIDLVATAQALHHIHEPVPVIREMARITREEGNVLIVDQVCTESYEQAAIMNELEIVRDPTHAATRPASAFRIMVRKAGLEIVDERLWEGRARFSEWMWPQEFPAERIAATRSFIERFGEATGMNWERDGDDWTYTRRRLMILAARPRAPEKMTG
jgi:ubiquinone/menaquinone biosynthesis C-methylase UbiE